MTRTFVKIEDVRSNEKYLLIYEGEMSKDEAIKLAKKRCGDNSSSDKIYYDVEYNVCK